MFDSFKKAVLNAYAERKANNKLSDNLINPTRVKLKNECLGILRNRYDKKDDQTIKAFFDPYNEFGSHEQSIDKFDLDGFQALITFFKRDINIRKEENIKLLAWLINFEPRPYVFGEIYDEKEVSKAPIETEESKKEVPIPDTKEPETIVELEPGIPWKKVGPIAAIVILSLAFGLYSYNKTADSKGDAIANTSLPSDNGTTHAIPNNDGKLPISKVSKIESKQCMFWTGDHYEPIDCSQVLDDTPILALDIQKVKSLKRITRPDTLSRKDLSKTWYFKVNVDSIEFYTDSGSYPLDSKKRLKPLTLHMLTKYPNGYNIYKRLTSN
jgi:hypothetical protein